MNQKITWEEMKERYPNEWLMVSDYELDKFGEVAVGIVERHSKDKEDIYRLPALNKSVAFEYTGESTFRGLRSHAE